MKDPIVIDPPNFDIAEAWGQHRKWVDDAGGLTHEDGEVNWRAAFSADPGCCSCPACHEMYWAFGRRQRCSQCGFEYPTDWWAMYSWGVHDHGKGEHHRYKFKERMQHPYYRYGFEHPVEDPWKEHDKIDWKVVFGCKS